MIPALGVAALALLVAVSLGFDYGIGNQPTYLLDGLRRVDPDVLAGDWLASETYAYHPVFGWVVWLAAQVGPLPWTLTILNTLLVAAALSGLAWLARWLAGAGPGAWLAGLLLLALVAIDETHGIGGSYVFGDSLQPSALASAAFLVAIGAFLGGRWLASGAALAVAGAFHVNYLVLGIGVFGLAHLLLGARGLVPRLARQLAPPLLVLAAYLPVLLDVGTAADAAEGARIFMNVRAPHHYLPRRYLHELVPFLAWQAAALALWPYARLGARVSRALATLWAALALPVLAATLLNSVTFVTQVSQLFPWRMAPFAVLLAQMVACAACARLVLQPASGDARHRAGAGWLRGGAAVVAVGLVVVYRVAHVGERLGGRLVATLALAGVVAAVSVAVVAAPRLPAVVTRWGLVAAVLLGIAAPVRSGLRYVQQTSTLLHGDGILPEGGLYRWARSMPPATRFLVPPSLDEFRLRTLRPIVVDWKSTPVRPDELIEWHRRIEAVAGRPVRSLADAVRGYATLDSARLAALCERYRVDYAVLRRRDTAAVARLAGTFPVVYADRRFLVLDLREGAGQGAPASAAVRGRPVVQASATGGSAVRAAGPKLSGSRRATSGLSPARARSRPPP
ncbi:MAG TPA: DUF6798 domain-containing protein [Gemmatimonadaceae bacterium]|nr:DUF6798 domain-containing protein [Gemmatimonadaceae bacterium]